MKNNKYFLEKLYNNLGQFIKVNNIIYYKKTKFQKIKIYQNKILGKILTINNVIQTTELDEFIYHEMICLVPIFIYEKPKNILIIGGGDGGCLKQIIKFKYIKSITLVEIDKKIIECSKKYLFNIHQNSFKDKRVKIFIQDGINFLKTNDKKFDIIIVDGTDPIGPGKILFQEKFFQKCKNSLSKNGIFVIQNGIFMLQKKNVINSYKIIKQIFQFTEIYQAAVPTYYGGNILFIIASNKINIKNKNNNIIKNQYKYNFKYYNPYIHIGSFYLPQFIIDQIN